MRKRPPILDLLSAAQKERLNQDELDFLRSEANFALDYFLAPYNRLIQNRTQFCINSDSAALALFVSKIRNRKVLEIGCNNGAILAYISQENPAFLCGVELQESAAKLAQINMKLFSKTSSFEIRNGSILDLNAGEFDLVLCNPPYFAPSPEQAVRPLTSREIARVEGDLNLKTMIESARRHLKSGGRFCFVHRPSRLTEIFALLKENRFSISRLQTAYDIRTFQPCAVLVEAVLDRFVDPVLETALLYDGTCRPKTMEEYFRTHDLNGSAAGAEINPDSTDGTCMVRKEGEENDGKQ